MVSTTSYYVGPGSESVLVKKKMYHIMIRINNPDSRFVIYEVHMVSTEWTVETENINLAYIVKELLCSN